MIAIARADDVRLISDGEGGWISVPDIKIPQGIEWSASGVDGHNAFYVKFNGRTTLWHGPHTIDLGNGPAKYFFVDAPKPFLARLRDQLGSANVKKLIVALKQSKPLRQWCRANGFRIVRNSLGRPVNIYPPLVIARGGVPYDMDGIDIEDADELADLEV